MLRRHRRTFLFLATILISALVAGLAGPGRAGVGEPARAAAKAAFQAKLATFGARLADAVPDTITVEIPLDAEVDRAVLAARVNELNNRNPLFSDTIREEIERYQPDLPPGGGALHWVDVDGQVTLTSTSLVFTLEADDDHPDLTWYQDLILAAIGWGLQWALTAICGLIVPAFVLTCGAVGGFLAGFTTWIIKAHWENRLDDWHQYLYAFAAGLAGAAAGTFQAFWESRFGDWIRSGEGREWVLKQMKAIAAKWRNSWWPALADTISATADWVAARWGDIWAAVQRPPAPTPPPPPLSLRVMPLGDSITQGVGGSPAGTGYRARLWDLLSDQPGALDFVGSVDTGELPDTNHEGHPGWKINQINSLVRDCPVARYRPNVVTLHIGTNDLRSAVDIPATVGQLRTLINTTLRRGPESTVFVATLVPSLSPDINARVQQYNAQVVSLVGELRAVGRPVRLVSMSAVTAADMTDGLHPNNTGYRKMADAFDGAIDSALTEGLIRPPRTGDPGACGVPPSTTPPPTGPRPEGWNYVGEVAAGAGPREQVRFADLNGDGRDDYLLVGDQGQVRAWLNAGVGNGVSWQSRGQVASGSGPREQIRFADLNGDGRDDYLVVGDQGQVKAWFNVGVGDGVAWAAQGEIASGVGATRDQIRFADIDVDGRDDYLVVDSVGRVRAWQNNIGGAGSPWGGLGEIASGVGANGNQVRFADLNGDGRDDYLVVDEQAGIRAWLNNIGTGGRPWGYEGTVAGGAGVTSAELDLADLNGDGRDDYLKVGASGQVTAWLNDRYGRPDPWAWQGLIASSGAPRQQVRWADLNGDGRDDYLVVGGQGQVSAWFNVRDSGGVGWDWRGEVASGSGPREQIRFADLNGDGRDDYLVVGDQGQVKAWLNAGTGNAVAWSSIGQVAAGSGPRDQIRFADVNGDNRDDYLVVGDQGQVKAWLNAGTGNTVSWASQGEVTSGFGAAGATVTFADLNGDRRDDYLVLGEYGQVRAWINNRGGPGSAWLSRGEIASGVGYPRSQVELAEINGDRRADYLVLDDQGGVRAWFNNEAAGGPAPGNPPVMPGDPTPAPPNDNGSRQTNVLPLCVANRCPH
ncbi:MULTISPECIES: FG-GAP-like repeat-containing protein [unclassified Micromonospora]|uniref:FG-GAP-like repeat-containing protein n=1 Tax=unclassified Micromonospora TaxID=2617518 RepID=UPI001C60164A|nr:FG-GAP-like repeat-containing protein [Micromonospora sp. RL09-050-HVF-A]MBW4700450.1 VCBS repeat-containing protein [Micromonospora sp. RL09-050-HVF-A]